jgi:hypothetical protein
VCVKTSFDRTIDREIMEPSAFLEDDEIVTEIPSRRSNQKQSQRSYFAFCLNELREFNGPKYKFGLLLIPLRHCLTYSLFFSSLLLLLLIIGTILYQIAIPSDYFGPAFDPLYAILWGYAAFSGVMMIFVMVSWFRLWVDVLIRRKGVNNVI